MSACQRIQSLFKNPTLYVPNTVMEAQKPKTYGPTAIPGSFVLSVAPTAGFDAFMVQKISTQIEVD